MTTPPRRRPHYDKYKDKAQALRRRSQATNAPCWICGHPIDYTLPANHPMAFTADHINPISLGGNIRGELRAAHRGCNSRRSNKPGARITRIEPPTTTRNW